MLQPFLHLIFDCCRVEERKEYFGNYVEIQDPAYPDDDTKKIKQFRWSNEPVTLIGVLKLPM